MKGLMLKDFYTLGRQAKIFVLFILVFTVIGNSMSAFAVVYASMLPITALAFDEQSKWDSLAAMMPYSTRDLVLSKYCLGYAGIGVAGVFAVLVQFAVGYAKNAVPGKEAFYTLAGGAVAATIMLSVNLPFMFRFGVEKGRIAFCILLAITVFVGMTCGDALVPFLEKVDLPVAVIIAIILGVVVLFNLLSILLSLAFYRHKH